MLKKHVSGRMVENLGHEPTLSQYDAIEALGEFIVTTEPQQLFILKGYAGTGKTTLIGSMVKTLQHFKIKVFLMAPTGRAAKVMQSYSGYPASTIHKKIYRQKSADDGVGSFVLDRNLHSDTFFIVDEASMISNRGGEGSSFGSGRLLEDLLNYVYPQKRCKLIVCGDLAQLPPVGLTLSPALDQKYIASQGFKVVVKTLTDIVRQADQSGILVNASNIRSQISQGKNNFPALMLEGFADVRKITGTDLLEEINWAYDHFGMEETKIICRSNKRANKFNQGIRNQILFREEELSAGDILMVVKNNYFYTDAFENTDFIANGDIAEVMRIGKQETLYNQRFAHATLRFPDYNDTELEALLLLDTLQSEAPALTSEQNRDFYALIKEDYIHIGNKRKQYEEIRKNAHFNALQVKFAYALTCHKAQGGQWKAVFIDQGYLTKEMMDREFLRWLYTAFTRSTEIIYLVNFNKEFFEQGSEIENR